MKKNMLSFVSGMIAMLLLVGLPVTALAVSGAIRIEVSPISVLRCTTGSGYRSHW